MIAVVGASGFVGRRVLARLVAEDQAVRGLVRDRQGMPALQGTKAELVEADLTRPDTLAPALAGVTVVVHCAAITADHKEPRPGAYREVNQVGTESLMAAAEEVGIERLVLLSGLGARPAPAKSYMATRWGMEKVVQSSAVPFVILQPSVLFGAGAPFVRALAQLVKMAPVTPLVGGDVPLQPFWVEDLVTCLVRCALEPRFEGQSIPLGGPEQLTMRRILELIAATTGKRRYLLPVPISLANWQARILTAVLAAPPLTPATVDFLRFPNVTSPDACERAFGFEPRSFAAHLNQHGLEA
jgi:uncharacterized protein YbjT (DUF2867 family)